MQLRGGPALAGGGVFCGVVGFDWEVAPNPGSIKFKQHIEIKCKQFCLFVESDVKKFPGNKMLSEFYSAL